MPGSALQEYRDRESVDEGNAQGLTGRGIVFGPTKTDRSRRAISLSPDAVLFFRDHQIGQLEHVCLMGVGYNDHDLVFAHESGDPYEPRQVSKSFARLLERYSLDKLRIHDLRHTMATLYLSAGVHAKVVSERLGHGKVGITLDTYSHVLPDLQDDAATTMDTLLKKKSRDEGAHS